MRGSPLPPPTLVWREMHLPGLSTATSAACQRRSPGSALVAGRQLDGFTCYARGNIRFCNKHSALAIDDVTELVVNHKRPLLP
jgi:hypothetical protein